MALQTALSNACRVAHEVRFPSSLTVWDLRVDAILCNLPAVLYSVGYISELLVSIVFGVYNYLKYVTCNRNFLSVLFTGLGFAGTIIETCRNNMASDYLFMKVFNNARPTCILPVVNHGNHERNNCVITIIYAITIRFFVITLRFVQ